MASLNIGNVLTFAGTIVLDVSTDLVELRAGQQVALPQVQIGTDEGRPIHVVSYLIEGPAPGVAPVATAPGQ